VNENEDQVSIAQKQCATLKAIEYELFGARVKHDITVALLHMYIQEWIKGVLDAIVNPP
jgi:hypothetical protein